MGPLFSFLLAAIGAVTIIAIAFGFSRFKHSTAFSLILAVSFAGGGAVGFATAVLLATLVVGVGATLESTISVVFYLAWLAAASIAGAIASVCLIPPIVTRMWSRGPRV